MGPWLVGSASLAGSLAVFIMWLHDTPPVVGEGPWLVAVGRVTGLEGTYALLLTIVLLARVWWIERLVGMEHLFTWHRRVSHTAVALLVAHAFFIIWGYAVSFHASVPAEAKYQVLDLPDVLAATVALALLVALAVVSLRRLRRRLAYQTWYFIHLYAYVAVALSFAHQFATGADFASHPLNRELWGGGYVLTFGLLVWYRAIVPVRSSWRHHLRVSHVEPEGAGSTSIYITGRNLAALGGEPGQFFIWRFLTRDGWWQAHPFSLSAPVHEDRLRLTVRASGDFTSALPALPQGSRVVAEGPFGRFTARARRRRRVVLVAAGAGIAPVRALFETIAADPGELTLIFRAHDETDLSLRAEIDRIASERGARVEYVVGSRAERTEFDDPMALADFVGRSDDCDVFLCGPRGFMERSRRTLIAMGVPRGRVHAEYFET